MKRILMSLYSLHMGGIETTSIDYMNLFISQGWKVDLYLINHQKGVLLNRIPKEVTIITPSKNLASRWHKYRSVGESLLGIKVHHKLIKEEAKKNTNQYDLAIAFEGYHNHSDLYAAFVNAKSKTIWVHNNYIDTAQRSLKDTILLQSMKKKYNTFNHIVCVSDNAKNAFSQWLPAQAYKCLVLKNPFDANRIRKLALKNTKATLLPENCFHIISIGRLSSVKGFDRLITAFNQVITAKQYSKSPHLTIIGDGKERRNLKKLVQKLKLE